MNRHTPEEKKQFRKLFAAAAGLVAVIGLLSLLCLPLIRALSDPANQQRLQEWINSLGFGGWLILLGIQILQIVVAFIPGEPVELLAGVLYGSWGGLFTCLLGIVLASSGVFFLTRKFGYKLVTRIFGEQKLREFKFLGDTKKVETVTFILFLIPGTPKDMLTYLAGVTRIRPAQFLLLSTFARIPSIITSTWMGASVSRGNWGTAIGVFLLTAAIGLFGIFFKQKILDWLHKFHREH